MFGKFLKRMDAHSGFMGRMMDRLGVDTERLARSGSGQDLAQAARRCMTCSAEVECQRYLNDPTTNGSPDFCPNAGLFRANRADAGTV